MKPVHWVLVAGLALAVPAAYAAAFAAGVAIGWNKAAKRAPRPVTIRYVDRPAEPSIAGSAPAAR